MSVLNRTLLLITAVLLISYFTFDWIFPKDQAKIIPLSYINSTGTVSSIKKKLEYYWYYPYWKHAEFAPSKIPSGYFNWIFHAFIWPDETWKLIIPEWFDASKARTFLEKWKLVSISVGGWENSEWFKVIAENPESRKRFINELKEFVERNWYNGVDLDWEYPVWAKQSDEFVLLANEIRRSMPWITLTAALPISLSTLGIEKIFEIQKSLDFILVMAYDMEDWFDWYAWINAPLYPNEKMPEDRSIATLLEVNYLNEWVPKEKIMLWLPLYGRKYNALSPYENTYWSDDIEYKNLPFDLCEKKSELWPVLICGNSYISYDDMNSIEEKMRFAKDKWLKGVFFWALWQDDNKLIYKLRNKINKPVKNR
ncbi:MAG: hypothetical protein ACD_3C00066G0003 [uncultured bacterium (gcode 4)]|uniref:chitinase n=1 Tax=uncultured bacterium (gcode 4) TaxID=1234023 RepID=K2FB93_9BACT|nr:MAG: hypothetical protein ACD_3C00066G0003 [uncultured bacterium (gcode 4)]